MTNTVRMVQIAWFDVKHYDGEQDWEINSYEDLDQNIDRFKKHFGVISTEQAQILREYTEWLKSTTN